MKTVMLLVLAGVALGRPAVAQGKLPLGTPVGGDASGAPSNYDDGGRRDPFVSLLVPKKAPSSTRPRPGLGSVSIADVSVKGIVRAGSTVAAILEGPDGKSFVAHLNDKLQDAVVKTIDAAGVVFVGQVVDALGVTHARDVRKTLRPQPTEEER